MQEKVRETLEGKVAKILNNRELVINRGSEHGIHQGMKFKVVEESESIIDPDTNQPLGTISREKIRVKVVDVQPKFAIAQTYQTYLVQRLFPPPFLPDILRIGDLVGPITRVRTLRSAQTEDETATPVSIGDKVFLLDEFEE